MDQWDFVFSWIFPFPQATYCDKQCHQSTKAHHFNGAYPSLGRYLWTSSRFFWYLPSSITLYVNHFQSKGIWKLLNQTDITCSSNNVNCLQSGLLPLLQISTVLCLYYPVQLSPSRLFIPHCVDLYCVIILFHGSGVCAHHGEGRAWSHVSPAVNIRAVTR